MARCTETGEHISPNPLHSEADNRGYRISHQSRALDMRAGVGQRAQTEQSKQPNTG